MDIKSFVSGAACGALTVGIMSWLPDADDRERLVEDPEAKASLSDAPSAEAPVSTDARPPVSTSARETNIAEPEVEGDDALISTEILPQPAATTNSAYRSEPVPIPRSDLHEKVYGENSGVAERHADLEAEPKDDSWAYYMEQAITQFLAGHRLMSQFNIFHVECRTVTCELQVIGYDESTGPVWAQVMYDMGQQPWWDFGQTGSTWDTVDGSLAIVTRLVRL